MAFGTRSEAEPTRAVTAGSGGGKSWPRRPGCAQLHDDRLVPDRRVIVAKLGRAHASTSVSCRNQPIDVGSGVNLGDAVEGRLAELGQVIREVLAAEDPVLPEQAPIDLGDTAAGGVEVDDELLEEAGGEGQPHAADGAEAARCVVAAGDDQLAKLAEPSGPSSAM